MTGLDLISKKMDPNPCLLWWEEVDPNLIRGMAYLRDILESLGIPYRFFGHDSAMSEVINYAMALING